MEEKQVFSEFVNDDFNLENYEVNKRSFAFELMVDKIKLYLKYYLKWKEENNIHNKNGMLTVLAKEDLLITEELKDFLELNYSYLKINEKIIIKDYVEKLENIIKEMTNFNESIINEMININKTMSNVLKED